MRKRTGKQASEYIAQIDKLRSEGKTVEAAAKEVGIKAQTYWNAKTHLARRARRAGRTKTRSTESSSTELSTLAALASLSAESRRIVIKLAEQFGRNTGV